MLTLVTGELRVKKCAKKNKCVPVWYLVFLEGTVLTKRVSLVSWWTNLYLVCTHFCWSFIVNMVSST